MPRSVDEIVEHADELARRFEDYAPRAGDERDGGAIDALREAVSARASAELAVRDAVGRARAAGLSWALVGSMIGTSGEAARQRYGAQRAGTR
jgi:hypothetical protein